MSSQSVLDNFPLPPPHQNRSPFLLLCATWSIWLRFRGHTEWKSIHWHARIKFNTVRDLDSVSSYTRCLETDSMWENSRPPSSTSCLHCIKRNRITMVFKLFGVLLLGVWGFGFSPKIWISLNYIHRNVTLFISCLSCSYRWLEF